MHTVCACSDTDIGHYQRIQDIAISDSIVSKQENSVGRQEANGALCLVAVVETSVRVFSQADVTFKWPANRAISHPGQHS